MQDIEVLKTYRDAVRELSLLQRQLEMCLSTGAPREAQASGQGIRGTNNHQAAQMQQYEGLSALLARKQAALADVALRFEQIMEQVPGQRLRLILRSYYALGMTDEAISRELGMTCRRINEVRNQFLRSLTAAEAA